MKTKAICRFNASDIFHNITQKGPHRCGPFFMNYLFYRKKITSSLLERTFYDGIFEIPRLEPLEQIVEPAALAPFSKRQKARDRFVHFYEHEAHYQDFTNHPEKYIKDLLEHPGIISPDNSILVEAPLCAQIANLFLSRRNASFLQHSGVYQIPHNSIVSIGTYGAAKPKMKND